MWRIKNATPYAAGRTWIRGQDGGHRWLVAVKASFDVTEAGVVTLAEEQRPVLSACVYFGDPRQSGVRHDSDLAGMKAATDVIVHAHAHLGEADGVNVRVRVGALDKQLFVQRTREEMSSRIPIIYQLAQGGVGHDGQVDPRNPIGVGAGREANVLYALGESKGPSPAGFAGIAPHWSPRKEMAGTYDEQWAAGTRPLLPKDYSPLFHSCAPEDQRIEGYLRGGEVVELSNMTPSGVLRFTLPKSRIMCKTRIRGRLREQEAMITGITIEPDIGQLTVVWQCETPIVNNDVDYLDWTYIHEKAYLR